MKKPSVVILLLLIAGGLWALSTQEFIQVPTGNDLSLVGVQDNQTGTDSTAVLGALAGIAAVLSLLMALLGTVGRWIVGGLSTLTGLAYAVTALSLLRIEGATALPWFAAGAGILAAIFASYATYTSGRWKTTHKYDQKTQDTHHLDDPVDTWDALSRGEDPS